MGKFFAELKRRRLYRVGAAYAVVAWLLLQLVNNVTPLMRLPERAGLRRGFLEDHDGAAALAR